MQERIILRKLKDGDENALALERKDTRELLLQQ